MRIHTGERLHDCLVRYFTLNKYSSFSLSPAPSLFLSPPLSFRRKALPVYTVPGCGKRFTEYSSLYKHHVVHTPCKPYNCNYCGKTYKQISTLAMHKRTAHNDTEPIEEEQQAYFEQPTGQCLCVRLCT